MIRLIFYLMFLFVSFNVSGQKITLQGVLKDPNNNPIISASIILKGDSGKIVSFTYSDELGKYLLQTDKKGPFNLLVNSIGFEQKNIEIHLGLEKEVIKIDLILNPKIIELKEIILDPSRPITIKKDTIIFDLKYFAQGNEQVVEDLLKKIPGLNVSPDGTIKVGNQEIEKVMIEGDDMFDKGYKILTKNMPVDPILKVELYQNYSNNKHLKGIENSEKVALNLILKEDFTRKWFGNMEAGYGLASKNPYEARANLLNFGKKTKYYFLTNLNNIGEDATGEINDLIRPGNYNDPGTMGDNQSANTLLQLNSELPNLKQKRVNFNKTKMLSLNSIFKLSEKVNLKALGFLNTDNNDFFRNSFQSFSAGTSTFNNTEELIGNRTQITGFGKVDLTYDISTNKTLEYTGKLNKSNEINKSDLLFNNNLLHERLTGNNQLFDHKILFTNKFKENKVLLLTGRYIKEKTPQNYSVNQFIFDDLFAENASNTHQYSQNQMQFAGVEVHMLDRKMQGDLLELKLGNQLRIDNLNSRFELLNNEVSIAFPTQYQNNLTYATNDLYFSTKYRFKFGNYTLLTQSDFHQIFNHLVNSEEKSAQNFFFITPKIGLDWKINGKNKIITSYTYNTTNAGILDLYPGFVQTGFRSFSKGLDEFTQLNASSAILDYTFGNWGDKFFANTFILYSKNNDFYSTNSIIAQNHSLLKKIIIKDREFISMSSNIDRYFKPIKSNLKITLTGTKTNFKNIINNSNLRAVKYLSAEYGIELRSGFKGIFNYHLGSKWNYNRVKTPIEKSFTDNMSFLDLSFMFTDKFNVQIQSERYFLGNLDKKANKYYFLDLESRYVLIENKLSFALSCNNLLNTETFRSYTITDIIISTTQYKLQPRYFLLKIDLRF